MPDTERQLLQIINDHMQRRRAALNTIAAALPQPGQDPGPATTEALAYLDTWRIAQKTEIDQVLAPHRTTPDDLGASNFHDPGGPMADIPPQLLLLAISWHQANQRAIQALSTDALALHHQAASVLTSTPDMLTHIDLLDEQDTTVALLNAAAALQILAPHLESADSDDLITQALDLQRPAGPVLQRITIDIDGADANPVPPTDQAGPTSPPPGSGFLAWAHATTDAIERGIRTYLEAHRWDSRGQHFGAVVQQFNDRALPTLLRDPKPIKYTLTSDTAATITLLKNGQAPDHTEGLSAVIAWYEALVLWCDEHNAAEIPPAEVKRLAELYQVPILPLEPTQT